MGGAHVTIDDVARHAGLSVATVSRVMHDSPLVRPATRARVLRSVEVLGYSPSALARGLAMSSTYTIGVLVGSFADPFWAEVVRGIESQARASGYAVLITSSDDDAAQERAALGLFRHKRVDGIIVCASREGTAQTTERQAISMPTVYVNVEQLPLDAGSGRGDNNGGDQPSPLVNVVATDDQFGARLAMEHLLTLGHRRIAFIGPTDRASAVARRRGYTDALERAGLSPNHAYIVEAAGVARAEEAGESLLRRRSRPTALFCYDDVTALGALRAVRAAGLCVPADVSVVGFDDIPLAAYLEPPLTTVRQPMYEMGRRAMAMLLQLARGGSDVPGITLAGMLVTRASTGVPREEPYR